jgi:hypothetical protein
VVQVGPEIKLRDPIPQITKATSVEVVAKVVEACLASERP